MTVVDVMETIKSGLEQNEQPPRHYCMADLFSHVCFLKGSELMDESQSGLILAMGVQLIEVKACTTQVFQFDNYELVGTLEQILNDHDSKDP